MMSGADAGPPNTRVVPRRPRPGRPARIAGAHEGDGRPVHGVGEGRGRVLARDASRRARRRGSRRRTARRGSGTTSPWSATPTRSGTPRSGASPRAAATRGRRACGRSGRWRSGRAPRPCPCGARRGSRRGTAPLRSAQPEARPAEREPGGHQAQLAAVAVDDHRELVVGRTEHEQLVGADARGDRVDGRLGEQLAVDHGAEREPEPEEAAQPVDLARALGVGRVLASVVDLARGQRAEALAGRLDAGERREPLRMPRARSSGTSAAAPDMHHTARNSCWAAGMPSSVSTAPPPADWPGDRHPGGVAAEGRDVLAHPLQGEQPVEHAAVRRRILDPAEAVKPRRYEIETVTTPSRLNAAPSYQGLAGEPEK